MTWQMWVSTFAAILVLLYGVGVGVRIFGVQKENMELGEKISFSLGLNVTLLGFLSFLLAVLGGFRVWLILVVYGVLLTLLLWWKGDVKGISLSAIRGIPKTGMDYPLILILIASAFIYMFSPIYYMWGARDYGIYLVNAVHTAETGSCFYETDEFINENYEDLKEFVHLGYLGFYSAYEEESDMQPGDISVQFLPIYWCLLAFGYSLMGMKGMMRITALITLVSLAIYYFFIKRTIHKGPAVLATLLLAICPAQIWGARITQSEQLAQLLFLLMCSLFSYGWKEKKNQYLYLATAVTGIGCFCRMDHYVLGLGILCMGCYAVLWNQKKKKTMLWVVLQYAGWLFLSLGYGFMFHAHYYQEHWEMGVLKYLVLGNFALLMLFAVLYVVTEKYQCKKNMLAEFCTKKVAVIVFSAFLTLIFVLLYFVLGNNLEQYCWYICPLTLLAACFGLYMFLRTKDKKEYRNKVEGLLLFVGVGLISTLLYSFRPSITMDHFWMSRRWIPVNFPFVIAMGMAGVHSLVWDFGKPRAWKNWIAIVVGAVIFSYVGYKDKDIIKETGGADILDGYQELVEQIPEDSIVFTSESVLASVLRYVYQKDVYLLKEDYHWKDISKFAGGKENIFFLGDVFQTQGDVLTNMELKEWYRGKIDGINLFGLYDEYPEEQGIYRCRIALTEIISDEGTGKEGVYCIPYMNLRYNSRRKDGEIIMTAVGDSCFFGPYLELDEGNYYLETEIVGEREPGDYLGYMEIVVDETVIGIYDIKEGMGVQKIPFTSEYEGGIVQFRFVKICEGKAVCKKLYYGKE